MTADQSPHWHFSPSIWLRYTKISDENTSKSDITMKKTYADLKRIICDV